MELALTIFAGLVLFAAFGKPTAKALQAISPSLPGFVGKLIRLIPWVSHPLIMIFAWVILREQKDWDDGQRFLFILGAVALMATIRLLCGFAADTLQAIDPVVKVVGRGIFAEEEPPKTGTDPAYSFKIDGDDDGEEWTVSFEEMKAHIERGKGGITSSQTYMLKRSKEGEWFARVKKKGSEWMPLEKVSERLSTVIETRWRKLVA